MQHQVGIEFAHGADQRHAILVQLTGQHRPAMRRHIVQDRGNLILDDRALFLDHQNFVAGFGEGAQPFRLHRPYQTHFIDGDTQRAAAALIQPQPAQGFHHVQISLAGGNDAETVMPRTAPCQPVQPVRAHPGLQRHVPLLVMPRFHFQSGPVACPQIQAFGRQFEIGRQRESQPVHIGRDRGTALHRIGQRLHANPRTAVAARRPGRQAVRNQLLNGRRIEHRHAEMDQCDVALVGQRGRARAMVVTAQRNGAAMLGRALIGRMLQHVAGAVNARALAVPKTKHAIKFRLRQQPHLLAAPHGGRGQILVRAGLKMDVVGNQVLLGTP